MIVENDKSYQTDINAIKTRAWMVNIYCAFAWMLFAIATFQVPVVLLITTQCIRIDAISVGGKRFQTDSRTCPDRSLPPLWTKRV